MAQVLADPTSAANLAALRPSATPLCVVASLPGAAACATARRLRDFVVPALRNSTLKVRLKVRSGWTGLLLIFLCAFASIRCQEPLCFFLFVLICFVWDVFFESWNGSAAYQVAPNHAFFALLDMDQQNVACPSIWHETPRVEEVWRHDYVSHYGLPLVGWCCIVGRWLGWVTISQVSIDVSKLIFEMSETPTSTATRCRSSARHRAIWSRRWQLCLLIMELYMRWWPLLVQWSYVRAPVTCYQSRAPNCLALWRVLDWGMVGDSYKITRFTQEICPFTER